MKNRKQLTAFICISMIFCYMLAGCSTENDKIKQNNEKNQESANAGKVFSAQGRIVKIDENGIHVMVKDKVQRYNVDKAVADKYYVGEYVGVKNLENNKFDVSVDNTYDFKNRLTSAGDKIKRVTGTVGEVKDNLVTAVTEMGDIKLNNPGNFNLKNGAQVMFDYVEMPGGNQMISFYEEASKINAKVKEISRDTYGKMRIYAEGRDKKEYDIQTDENTVTNFSYSSLKKDDNITVYPNEMTGNVPSAVKPKLIIKD